MQTRIWTRKSKSALNVVPVCLSLLAGLMATVPVGASDLATVMKSGRLAKLPVSWFHKQTVTLGPLPTSQGEPADVHVKLECFDYPFSDSVSDGGLLVKDADGDLYFSDDDARAGQNGLGAYITIDRPVDKTTNFDLYAFSMGRGTAYCKLSTSADGGQSWTLRREDSFGGALVDVGPLNSGDSLEVFSDNRFKTLPFLGTDDTRMVLFNPGKRQGPIEADDISTTDWDPKIQISNTDWAEPTPFLYSKKAYRNYLLVGKVDRSSTQLGVEARVDLVRGPLDYAEYNGLFSQTGVGEPAYLDAGRYYVSVLAQAESRIGDPVPGDPRPAFETGFPQCSNQERGEFNDLMFSLNMERERVTPAGIHEWITVLSSESPTRFVNRAMLAAGGSEDQSWVRITVELEVPKPGLYRLMGTTLTPGFRYDRYWHAIRNPNVSELRVVSYNILHDFHPVYENKVRNAADLLATRGQVDPAILSVEEPPDQAPYEWEADIVGFQELKDVSDQDFYGQVFTDEAESRGTLRWNRVTGRVEARPVLEDKAFGPVAVNEYFTPAGGLGFNGTAEAAAGCDGAGNPNYAQCPLPDNGDLFDVNNFAVPARTAVRRYGQTEDIPVAVFNTHLEYDDGDDNSADRFKELREMISVIRKLLAAEPSAFNNSVGDPLRTSPLHGENRIILTGDFNMRAHHCGEHQWFIKELRSRFGYALDVSQATFDPIFGVHSGTHDISGRVPDPLPFSSEWIDHPQFDMLSPFPWWATTYRGKTGGPGYRTDRYDAIILVGRGWAKDDPVIDYRVMNDNNFSTIMNDADAGVEMWQPYGYTQPPPGVPGPGSYYPVCNTAQSVSDGTGYRPNHDLGCGTGQGQPALHSDHRPIGARIRIGGLPILPSP